MDEILDGILKSNHSETFKLQLIEKVVIPAAVKPLSKGNYLCILTMSYKMAIYYDSELIRDMGFKLFLTYSKNNRSSFEEFCSEYGIHKCLTDENVIDKKRMVEIVHNTLNLIKNEAILKEYVKSIQDVISEAIVNCRQSLPATKALVIMLKEFTICLPSNDRIKFYSSLMTAINTFHPVGKEPGELTSFVADITKVCSLLKQMWSTSSESELLKCLSIIYKLLCQPDKSSLALAAVAQVFPVSVIGMAKNLINEQALITDDTQLTRVLERMIKWMNWPISTNIHLWILHMLQELVNAKKYKLLTEVTISKIEQIADRLFIPVGRSGAFAVFSFLLLCNQQSPEAFHKVLNQIGRLVEIFKNEANLMDNFVELVHCMFFLHSGFPELYEPILRSISAYPVPSSQHIKKLTDEYKWDVKKTRTYSKRDISNLHSSRRGKSRSAAGYVGLENLGNICYMNSIIQALFMSNKFVADVMKSCHPSTSIFGSLQHLFAFLIHSQRISFSPSSFLHISKPPWFENGRQQDCSEFLRYLLDVLHEQSKANKEQSVVQDAFFGKTETSYQCLNCKTISCKCDDVVDIGLTFSEEFNSKNSATYQYRTRQKTAEASSDSNSSEKKDLCLEDLMEHYFKPEKLEGDNQYFCEKCASLQDATRTVQITKAPKHLVLHLLRFSYNLKSHSRSKIFVDVKYPKILTMSSGSDAVKNIYSLFAVVVHSGLTSDCGHYYTYARTLRNESLNIDTNNIKPDTDLFTDEWYLFNDSNVSKSSYESFGNVTRRFPNDTAYMLFYQKVDLNEKVTHENLKDMQLPKNLSQMVLQDNEALTQEEEEKESENKRSKSSFFTSKITSWRDFDEDGNSPQGGSSCGHGNLDLSVSRFVF